MRRVNGHRERKGSDRSARSFLAGELDRRCDGGSPTPVTRPATSSMSIDPTLVLLPGLDGTGLLFGPLRSALPSTFPVEVVSYPPDRVVGYAALADEVADRLPPDGPFVLVAESFGGPLATLLAARRPAGLIGLVLCATFVTWPRPWLGRIVRPLAWPLPLRIYPAYRRWRARGRPATGSWVAAAEAARGVDPAVLADRVRSVFAVDVRAALSACPVPILYLRAASDRLVPPRNARLVRRLRPDATVVRIKSSHQLLQRRPAECAASIVRFARAVYAGP